MNTPYSTQFFSDHDAGAKASAEAIVPHVLSLFDVRSVVDVGCGLGGWLQAFECGGVTDYLGVDGPYLPRDMLKVPLERFQPVDLTKRLSLARTFDLACCLEVAEHLPPACAEPLVEDLIGLAPIVLFSAAIPGQGGTEHLNERWPSYWAALFRRHDWIAIDCLRPRVFQNNDVDWWYRQNLLVYCRPGHCPLTYRPSTTAYELDRIDPGMVEHLCSAPYSGSRAAKSIVNAALRRVRLRALKSSAPR